MNQSRDLALPQSARALFARLTADLGAGFPPARLPELIAAYAELQRRQPLQPEPYLALAYAALELDRPDQALALTTRALRLQPGHPQAQALYQTLYRALKQT